MHREKRKSLKISYILIPVLIIMLISSVMLGGALAKTQKDYDKQIDLLTGTASTGTVLGGSPVLNENGDASQGKIFVNGDDLNLFKTSYDNEKGEVVVKSSDESKVIAPGTSNTETLRFTAPSDTTVDYGVYVKMYVDVSFSQDTSKKETLQGKADQLKNNPETLPIKIGVGKSNEKIELKDIDQYTKEGPIGAGPLIAQDVLYPGYSQNYDIKWEWDFERGKDTEEIRDHDLEDELLQVANIELKAEITTVSELDEQNQPVDDSEKGLSSDVITGDKVKKALVYVLIGAVVVAAIVLVVMIIKRKKNEKADGYDDNDGGNEIKQE